MTLSLAAVMGAVGSGAGARFPGGAAPVERTGGEAVGADVVHPADWNVEREPYTFDDTYGYTLWRPDTGDAHDHGGTPALRVALAYGLESGGMGAAVNGVRADHPDLSLTRQRVNVARQHRGVAIGTIPGSTPYTAVYVPVNGRVYKINVYADDPETSGLNDRARGLLADVRFEKPGRSVGSLDLPDANSPGALRGGGDPALQRREEAASEETPSLNTTSSTTRSSTGTSVPTYDEREIREGCWLAKSPFFFQTQQGEYANRGRYPSPHGGSGWTTVGSPNYWGEYTHGDLGYGRCASREWTNDKFAVDYPLTKGDVVFSPFERGTVTFAGRNESHKNYGIFVVIEHGNGKYVSMSAHLSGLAPGVKRGAGVTDGTVVGYAGDTGDPSIPVGPVHLHQAFYRYPEFLRDGSPYGGAGLRVPYHRYVGTAAGDGGGVYKFGRSRTAYQVAKGDFISN